MRSKAETPFAIYTLVSAALHFASETYYHVTIGQAVSAYVVDLIANALMLLAAGASLANREVSAAGWLAGARGFAFCLNYRSFFGRLRLQSDGAELEEPSAVLTILGITLVISALAFLYSMWLARPRRP